ncbi:methionyl-tRNA formyltransferase, mitochondrial isoform X1 [Diabrotica virgifera virgifera]|uniref:methionyl-tRNA formyltransferase n=1 Tax=Diabrotica virgifera virgifera TaxID=50390 RepID=A0ABM5JI50_DIAVI|nr:methionyl-tRNA formyltransferase, mitochondrial isoform X1 [Diabrotica virgifera virgifera]
MKFLWISERITVSVLPIRHYSSKPPWNVLFFGTDQFSLYTLKLLNRYHSKSELINKLDVLTSLKKNANVVHKYAEKHNLPLYDWPHIPGDRTYDVGLVVSFGYLIPEAIIAKFQYGILNVHASILPKWRGAAPIIHAIAHGDKESGITVMRIKPHHFDVGEILLQEKVPIGDNTEMPELHQCLGELGAKSLMKTLEDLPNYIQSAVPQSNDNVSYVSQYYLMARGHKVSWRRHESNVKIIIKIRLVVVFFFGAPKITPEFINIRWNQMTSTQVYNLYRALKGYSPVMSTWQGIPTKLSEIKICTDVNASEIEFGPGFVKYDKRTKVLKVLCADMTLVSVSSISVYGKRVMNATDFNNGFLKKTVIDLRYFK